MTAVGWIFFGIPAMCGVTFIGGRLLGARRSWLALVLAGMIGWSGAVLIAGEMRITPLSPMLSRC